MTHLDSNADMEKTSNEPLENPELLSNTLTSLDPGVEVEFHHRTWFAVIALLFANYVQVFCLLGPPQIVCSLTKLSLFARQQC